MITKFRRTSKLSKKLVNEKLNANKFDLENRKQRKAFLDAIAERPRLLNSIEEENRDEFLMLAIKENYRYFTYLDKEFYTEELASEYLYARLRDGSKDMFKNKQKNNYLRGIANVIDGNGDGFYDSFVGQVGDNFRYVVQKSYENKVLLSFNYATVDGDEVFYVDRELEVPTSLKSHFKVSFQMVDTLKFLEKMNVNVAQLGVEKIYNTFTDLICGNYKTFLREYIDYNDVGFYALTSTTPKVQEYIKAKFKDMFNEYGVEITEFVIKSINVPRELVYKIEDQALGIRLMRTKMEADNEFSQNSLNNYVAKLRALKEFPDVICPDSTEFEKDLALERELKKSGKYPEKLIDRNIGLANKEERVDKDVQQVKDVLPKRRWLTLAKVAYHTTFWMLVIVALAMFAVDPTGGITMVALGGVILLYGLIAFFAYDKFKAPDLIKKQQGGKE
ncbi:MAG: SPFH domain-containing protein [Clostridia bacterium]|nr:SPFH domain-containing protein [Clostridia bacterium]